MPCALTEVVGESNVQAVSDSLGRGSYQLEMELSFCYQKLVFPLLLRRITTILKNQFLPCLLQGPPHTERTGTSSLCPSRQLEASTLGLSSWRSDFKPVFSLSMVSSCIWQVSSSREPYCAFPVPHSQLFTHLLQSPY